MTAAPAGNFARFAARPLHGGGTSAHVWIDANRRYPDLDLDDCPEMVVVAPHPDDETLGIGATAAMLKMRGIISGGVGERWRGRAPRSRTVRTRPDGTNAARRTTPRGRHPRPAGTDPPRPAGWRVERARVSVGSARRDADAPVIDHDRTVVASASLVAGRVSGKANVCAGFSASADMWIVKTTPLGGLPRETALLIAWESGPGGQIASTTVGAPGISR